MKPIKDILSDTKPKNVKKVTKAFENGGCSQYMAQFLAEAAEDTAMDFPKVKCLVTDNYFCCYSLFASGFSNLMTVVPLNQIANLYRSNISNGEYDYDFFHLDLELYDGSKLHVGSVPRNAKTFMTIFEEVITYTRSRINVVGGY